MTSILVAEGLETVLNCQVRGEVPIQIDWRRNNTIIQTESGSRMSVESFLDKNTSILSTQLRIDQSARSDSGIYECLA
jgi:primosomal replication protein N